MNFENTVKNFTENNKKGLVFGCLFAAVFTVFYITFKMFPITPTWCFGIFLLSFFGGVYFARPSDRRTKISSFVFAGIVSFFLVARYTIVTGGEPRAWTLFQPALFVVLFMFYAVMSLGYVNIAKTISLDFGDGVKPTRKEYFAYVLILCAAWFTVFLTLGPIRMSPDSTWVVEQALEVLPLNDWHPVAYTLIVRFIMNIGIAIGGTNQAGAILFGLVQIVFLACSLGYSIYWMRKRGLPLLFSVFAVVFFCSSPMFGGNAITVWKDIPFHAIITLLILYLVDIVDSKGAIIETNKGLIKFVALGLGVCFFRGVGAIIMTAVCILVLAFYRTKFLKKAVVFFLMLLSVNLVTGPLYDALDIPTAQIQEQFSVPLQQITFSLIEGAELTEDQEERLTKFIDIEGVKINYVPNTSDPIKSGPYLDKEYFADNIPEFLLLWLELLPQNLDSYMTAWLTLTRGFWQTGFWDSGYVSYDDHSGYCDITYFEDNIFNKYLGIDLKGRYVESDVFIPPAFLGFAGLFAIALLISSKRSVYILPVTLYLIPWLGALATSPTYFSYRYVLTLPFAFPVLIFIMFKYKGYQSLKSDKNQQQTTETPKQTTDVKKDS